MGVCLQNGGHKADRCPKAGFPCTDCRVLYPHTLVEDIGRVMIPAVPRKCYGETLAVDIVSGTDFQQKFLIKLPCREK